MKLSKNLSLSEVIKSDTAMRLCVDNTPTDAHLENLKVIAEEIFQPIRDFFEEPIYVSSGYRSHAVNKAIGGSRTSQHSKGQALDIDQDNRGTKVSNRDIFFYILNNLDFDQLIAEYPENGKPAWVHVSYVSPEKNNRREVLVAKKIAGVTRYLPYNDKSDLR